MSQINLRSEHYDVPEMTLQSGVTGKETFIYSAILYQTACINSSKYCGLANQAGPSAEVPIFGSEGQECCSCCCMCATGCHPGLAPPARANRPLHLLLLPPAELRERQEMLYNQRVTLLLAGYKAEKSSRRGVASAPFEA